MILAIDTATPAVSVALADANELVATFSLLRGRRHVETLIPAIEQLLEHAQCSYRDLDAIAVDSGPGLFTGLRVGVATAKALALALNVPVLAASSLAILATDFAQRRSDADVLAVIDARRKEVYAQRFCIQGRLVSAVAPPLCIAASEAVRLLDGASNPMVIGDAAVGPSVFERCVVSTGFPNAARLALMASTIAPTHPDEVELLYLRAPDAEINWTSRS